VHQVEEGADAEIAFQIGPLAARQGVILVLDGQLVDAVQVLLAEADRQQRLGDRWRKAGVVRRISRARIPASPV